MIFFLVFGVAMLLIGVFFGVLALLSANERNLVSTTGELTQHKGHKNYKLKNGTVPNATEYTYTYMVNGKPYQLRGVHLTHPRNLRKRVPVVYLRAFPRCAYQDHFSGMVERLLAISWFTMGVFCIVIFAAVS